MTGLQGAAPPASSVDPAAVRRHAAVPNEAPPHRGGWTHEGRDFQACSAHRAAAERRDFARVETETAALLARLRSGKPDPAQDASFAASQRDYRMIWSSSLGGPAPLGVTCRAPRITVGGAIPLHRVTVHFSDAIGADNKPTGWRTSELLGRYGRAYNLALISDRRFPYADLCTPEAPADRHQLPPNIHNPQSLAATPGPLTDTPLTLHEAARRGALPALMRLLSRSDLASINAADDWRLTPLAWAVLSGRPDAVRVLLASGADPMGEECDIGLDASPVRLALALRDRSIAASLLTERTISRLQPWPEELLAAAVQGDHPTVVARILRERPGPIPRQQLLALARQHASPGARAVLLQTSDPRAAQEFLSEAIGAGDLSDMSRALAAGADPNGGPDPRQRPLGMAIQAGDVLGGGKTNVDAMVRLLLKAGADPNSPAEYGRIGYETGSTPRSVLYALVETATREVGGSDPGGAYAAGSAAQRRALDLLLKAGASPSAIPDGGRPLVIQAVFGPHIDPERCGAFSPLAGEWITPLVQAGMDVNAQWRGKTALEWLLTCENPDPDIIKELERNGARRVR
jgi:ankyrin repeat protein